MKTFWSGKRVLITGHTGFKGSWLALWLQELEAHVIGYSLPPPTTPSLFADASVHERMVSISGDIRDADHLRRVIQEYRPEIVLHLAAQSLVRYSYEHPVETFETNVVGLVQLLDALRHAPFVRAVVVVTSDKCYENREWLWGYRENEPMGGQDPYSCSKGCAELITAAYRRSFFGSGSTYIATARGGNVIGGGDWARDRLLPDLIRAFTQGATARIRNPNAVRPWQYVLDCLRGYLMLAERLWNEGAAFAEAWNFGPSADDHVPVRQVVERVCELWGSGARWEADDSPQCEEAHALRLDTTKARVRLGWRPTMNLDATLTAAVSWYKDWARGLNMRDRTLAQLREYQRRIEKL